MKSFAEFTRKYLYRDPFLVFSCEFCEICKKTFFTEQQRTTASDIALSIVAKEVLANETVNYEIRTKAYVLILARRVSY